MVITFDKYGKLSVKIIGQSFIPASVEFGENVVVHPFCVFAEDVKVPDNAIVGPLEHITVDFFDAKFTKKNKGGRPRKKK